MTRPATEMPWWNPRRHADRRPLLLARNRTQAAIRRWLDDNVGNQVSD